MIFFGGRGQTAYGGKKIFFLGGGGGKYPVGHAPVLSYLKSPTPDHFFVILHARLEVWESTRQPGVHTNSQVYFRIKICLPPTIWPHLLGPCVRAYTLPTCLYNATMKFMLQTQNCTVQILVHREFNMEMDTIIRIIGHINELMTYKSIPKSIHHRYHHTLLLIENYKCHRLNEIIIWK